MGSKNCVDSRRGLIMRHLQLRSYPVILSHVPPPPVCLPTSDSAKLIQLIFLIELFFLGQLKLSHRLQHIQNKKCYTESLSQLLHAMLREYESRVNVYFLVLTFVIFVFVNSVLQSKIKIRQVHHPTLLQFLASFSSFSMEYFQSV